MSSAGIVSPQTSTSTSSMAYIKALLFLAVAVAVACAAEEAPREKKQVLVGSPYTAFKYTDDGQYYPGKYETPTVKAAIPAFHGAIPAAIPAVHGAIPAAYPYAYAGHPYYY